MKLATALLHCPNFNNNNNKFNISSSSSLDTATTTALLRLEDIAVIQQQQQQQQDHYHHQFFMMFNRQKDTGTVIIDVDDGDVDGDDDNHHQASEATTTTTTTKTTSQEEMKHDHNEKKEVKTKSSKETSSSSSSTSTSSYNSNNNMKYHHQNQQPNNNNNNITAEAVYEYYRNEIFPALMASFPILINRLTQDLKSWLMIASHKILEFLMPIYSSWNQQLEVATNSTYIHTLAQLFQETTLALSTSNNTTSSTTTTTTLQNNAIAEFMLQHFDTNQDGTISPSELINMTEIVSILQSQTQHLPLEPQTFRTNIQSIAKWFSKEWPLMDWKIGVFLWKSFGGLIVLIVLLSIMPGRLHRISGKILRWPILGLTYFLVLTELLVYTVIRSFIRIAEIVIAKPKHRQLRYEMSQSTSYEDWYKHAIALDVSQKRDKWQRSVTDSTSYRYNWSLIKQLREDMAHARTSTHQNEEGGDSLLALAVLQQCTRKNVGGIMSEDLFSFTNTGEPKFIVNEFIDEVVTTLHWVTDEAIKRSSSSLNNETESKSAAEAEAAAAALTAATTSKKSSSEFDSKIAYEKRFERKVRAEKDKIWKSLVGWATLDFHGDTNNANHPSNAIPAVIKAQQQQKQQNAPPKSIIKKSASGGSSSSSSNGRGRSCKSSSRSKSPTTKNSPGREDDDDHHQIIERKRSGTNSSCENSAITMEQQYGGYDTAIGGGGGSSSQGSHGGGTEGGGGNSSAGGGPKQSLPPTFHREQLILFLKRARAAYGRTALCLSGGAMMGLYHFGHLRGLMETDCLPNIISGTSAGSIVGAVIATRTNAELRRDMTPEELGKRMTCFSRPWIQRLKSVWQNGYMFSGDDWYELVKWFTCGEMTFEEAFQKTGRTFCITLASTTKKAPPVLINHKTAPNVVVASAVVASASVPGFVAPAKLYIKDADGTVRIAGEETYFDGSIETDIPVNGLAEMLNCQFFVACQCNPHVVPFFFNAKGGVGRPSRWSSGEQEASWRGGFALAALEMYLKNDMKSKFIFLRDMEAAVGFTSTMMTQEFHGSTTIVPQVRFSDYFKLFSDPNPASLEGFFQAGSVAAYQHAAMIRLHYRIADAIDSCLEKLGPVDRRASKVKVSRRASFEMNETISKNISKAIAQHHHNDNDDDDAQNSQNTSPLNHNMPAVVTAALSERFESDSTSMSDDSYY